MTVFLSLSCKWMYVLFIRRIFDVWVARTSPNIRQPSIIAIETVSGDKHAAFHAWPVWLTGCLHPPIMTVLIIPHVPGRHYSGRICDELAPRWTHRRAVSVWKCQNAEKAAGCTSCSLKINLIEIPLMINSLFTVRKWEKNNKKYQLGFSSKSLPLPFQFSTPQPTPSCLYPPPPTVPHRSSSATSSIVWCWSGASAK